MKNFIALSVFALFVYGITYAIGGVAITSVGYGKITPGPEVERFGMQCQTFYHSKGPDQHICFEQGTPFKVLGYKLWDRVTPAFYFEEGHCTPLYEACPVSF